MCLLNWIVQLNSDLNHISEFDNAVADNLSRNEVSAIALDFEATTDAQD